ncbi:helix-turn-helix domain-containing protein [Pararhodospirillum oryzae]|uniref:Uncharacterized protein n=1 Tax=Pararhodospirillum oryzae TaxID=478448 RepID=A0A512HA13_9PROT|nr:helix-turn-helix transcriptional regulator [Pararhodospirillum oryzae]GEO82297.1 hypothetical protein ROR02_24280 [Pararhodospirillum oryzae]
MSSAPIPEPRWLALLRAEAGRGSIAAAARRVGISRAAASSLLSGTYPAVSTDAMAARVLAALDVRICPGLGAEMAPEVCADWQAKAHVLVATNGQRVAMYRACRACPHYLIQDKDAPHE